MEYGFRPAGANEQDAQVGLGVVDIPVSEPVPVVLAVGNFASVINNFCNLRDRAAITLIRGKGHFVTDMHSQ
jgi:hypothetical protein